MKRTFQIISQDIKNRVISEINDLTLEPLHEVVIREKKKSRTLAQNSLYWLWLTVIAAERGESKEDVHDRYKRKVLIGIFERDNKEYAEMIESIKNVHTSGMKMEAKTLFDQIVKLTSTTQANVKQFAEYLTDIEHDAIDMQMSLPHPEDRYHEAMGL